MRHFLAIDRNYILQLMPTLKVLSAFLAAAICPTLQPQRGSARSASSMPKAVDIRSDSIQRYFKTTGDVRVRHNCG